MIEAEIKVLNITKVELSELIKQSVLEIKDILIEKEDVLLSKMEATKMFFPPINHQTLTNWTKSGHIQEYRIGGRIFYKRSEILNKNKVLKRYKI